MTRDILDSKPKSFENFFEVDIPGLWLIINMAFQLIYITNQ